VQLLSLTLEEEKQTDLKLTEVTEQHVMPAAMGGGGDKDDEPSRKKSSVGRVKAA
jgi:hypothetical protein